MFPNYLFNQFSGSHQAAGQVPTKPDSLRQSGSDVWGQCTEAWTLMVSVLQFWTDEELVADGEIFGGRVRPTSALAQYVMDMINPHLEEGYKVTWEVVVYWMPWMQKQLLNTDSAEVQRIWRQPIPVEGQSSKLEVTMETCYNRELQEEQKSKSKPGTQPASSTPSTSRTPSGLGHSQTLKLHLKKATQGVGWTHIKLKDQGLDAGKKYKPPQ